MRRGKVLKDIYYVGGVVRDRLLGVPTEDVDMVFVPDEDVEKSIREVIAFMESRGFTLRMRTPFNTLKFEKGGKVVDVAMARRETYPHPASLPKVEPVFDIVEDLARRDFTINAMAMDMHGRIIDPFGGREHLRKKILIPISSFIDDPTRIFRGIRYARRLDLRYSRNFMRQTARGKRYIPVLSFARIKNELERITVERKRLHMWEDIVHWRLLGEGMIPPLLSEVEPHIPHEKGMWIFFFTSMGLTFHKLEHITRRERQYLESLPLAGEDDPMRIHKLLYNRDRYIALMLYVRTGRDFFLRYFERRDSCRKRIKGLKGEKFHRAWLECIYGRWDDSGNG